MCAEPGSPERVWLELWALRLSADRIRAGLRYTVYERCGLICAVTAGARVTQARHNVKCILYTMIRQCTTTVQAVTFMVKITGTRENLCLNESLSSLLLSGRHHARVLEHALIHLCFWAGKEDGPIREGVVEGEACPDEHDKDDGEAFELVRSTGHW
jgi:hypothetical protein